MEPKIQRVSDRSCKDMALWAQVYPLDGYRKVVSLMQIRCTDELCKLRTLFVFLST